ncbi:hypothetical protein KIF53_15500 [Chromobacterium subtsugae]|uniref:Uncharacterized protein n=1 Tax=Chromobacterium subtsugae TaxID=251747 RepID=A0ABS7FG34_9NEIS|nr:MULTISPECIES: hypothetical protein [Chromobacterium]MBW7567811.1 hypothetical protein [Chromobacterium subtsugae]MBW8289038.1 hypothetical protein [Chromobacterium subtsugae]WSE93818.1 hypothetical protein U6115_11400 [Chromobacterium subtsugae]WVH62195.1 hypothetical protein U6151_11420 [Chromobacterium subtsugae]
MAQLRICLLNPAEDISALKLRGWLQSEVAKIDQQASNGDLVLLRLYLTQPVRFGFAPQKLGVLLQSIVDKYSNIHSIELVEVKRPLTIEEMQKEAEAAQKELEDFEDWHSENEEFDSQAEGLVRYFGFRADQGEGEPPHCMISNIIEQNREPVSQHAGTEFSLGQWFVSEGAHEQSIVHGPFDTESVALDFAHKSCKAVRIVTEPEWFLPGGR